MRCLSYLILLMLVGVFSFGAGFYVRGGMPAAAEIATLANRISGATTSASPAPAPTASAAAGGSTGITVQRNGREATVQIDEATLTQQANANLAGQSIGDTPFGPATVRSLSVQLRNGEVAANGTAQVGPTVAPVNVTAGVRAENGRLRVGVTSAKVGGISLPGAMQQQIEQQLQAQIDQTMAQQRLQVRSVTVADGRITATGTTA